VQRRWDTERGRRNLAGSWLDVRICPRSVVGISRVRCGSRRLVLFDVDLDVQTKGDGFLAVRRALRIADVFTSERSFEATAGASRVFCGGNAGGRTAKLRDHNGPQRRAKPSVSYPIFPRSLRLEPTEVLRTVRCVAGKNLIGRPTG